ncbi:MAG TPA: MBL fold metallo-hydrolase [Baekduia sp.]|nr:MBL fold metallo-hydrolase [Baekduia sp.]
MKVTVLGKSPSWQDAGGACSGYLVQEDGATVLLDCGNGVFGKLRQHVDYVDVDAVVLSHLHADHILDLIPFSYALTYAPRQQPVPVHTWPGTDNPARPVLWAPQGARQVFRQVVGAWGNEDLVEKAFDLREYEPSDELDIGPMHLRFHPVDHWLPTCAIEVRCAHGRMTYGADTAPCDGLVEFARDTDLFVLEATLPRPERQGTRGHLTPGEAGDHGQRANVRRLVLTHISDELDPAWALEQAKQWFDGEVEMAVEDAVFTL